MKMIASFKISDNKFNAFTFITMLFVTTLSTYAYTQDISVNERQSNGHIRPMHTQYIAAGGGPGSQLPFLSLAGNQVNTWHSNSQSLRDIFPNGFIQKVTCNGQLCIAAGQYYNQLLQNYEMRIVRSLDKGLTWTLASLPNYNYMQGSVSHLSCTGTMGKSLCAAVGQMSSDRSFLIVSTDNGRIWTRANIPHIEDLHINGLSCMGSKDDFGCFFSSLKKVYATKNQTNVWNVSAVESQSDYEFRDISCTGTSFSNAYCAVLWHHKYYNTGIRYTSNGGKNWSWGHTNYTDVSLNHVSCTGSGDQVICAAAGSSFHYFYIIGTNIGATEWYYKEVQKTPFTRPEINSVSCTGMPPNAYCAVVGGEYEGTEHILIISRDNSNSWIMKKVPSVPNHYVLNDVKCIGDKDSGSCIAGGGFYINDTQPYLLIASDDAGYTWKIKDVKDRPMCPSRLGSVCSSIYSVAIAINGKQ